MSEEHEEIERTSEDLGISLDGLENSFRNGSLEVLRNNMWEMMENTDSWDIKSLEDARKYAEEYDRDIGSIIKGFESGDSLPAPIVLIKPDGVPYLVAGNTRLMVAKGLGVVPQVFVIEL